VVIVKEKKTYSYLPVLCANLLKEASKEFMKKIKPVSSEQNPKKVAPTIASLSPCSINIRACKRTCLKILGYHAAMI
jgi:hypothetical protein